MTIYAVVYSNYEPAEVDSLHFRKQDAEERSAALALEARATRNEVSMWEVSRMYVAGRPSPAQLHEDDPERCEHGRTIGNGYTCQEGRCRP